MLWLCLRLPQLPVEVLAGTRTNERLPRLERIASARLAVWAQQWSSHVHAVPPALAAPEPGDSHDALLWLEIGGSLKLFGGVHPLCHEVAAAVRQLAYQAELGVAPTPRAALLLTMGGGARTLPARVVTGLEELPPRLAPLPLEWLALPEAVHVALRSSGLRRVGEVLALPMSAVARRFGPAVSRYLQQLTGALPDPLPRATLPRRFQAQAEFAGEVHDSSALLFPLQRLFQELQGYLRARDSALQRCTLRLQHAPRHADTGITLSAAQPTRAAGDWLALARERLAALQLAAPVRTLWLEAEQFVPPAVLQGDFFSRERESAQQLQQVLDRLRARLGSDAVQQAVLRADHRPERAWQCGVAGLAALPAGESVAPASAARPCWLLPEPEIIAAPATLLAGPERIESGWWDGGDVARDYYLARTATGARHWVFQDLRSRRWYLQGLWA